MKTNGSGHLCVVQHEFCTINSKFKFLSCVYAELCFWIQLVCSAGSGGRLQGLSGAPDAPYPQMNTAGQDMSRDLPLDVLLYKVRMSPTHNGDAYLQKSHKYYLN